MKTIYSPLGHADETDDAPLSPPRESLEIDYDTESPVRESPYDVDSSQQTKPRVWPPPANYVCPLTLRLIREPVSDECGHSFEKTAINSWLDTHDFCPISRKPLCKEELYPNRSLETRIHHWKAGHAQNAETEDGEEFLGVVNGDVVKIDLMLLPQEKSMLKMIYYRALDLRRLRRKKSCLCSFAGGIICLSLIAVLFVLKKWRDGVVF